MRDHNAVQVEILNNALNTIVTEKDNTEAWAKLVNEVDVHRLQAIYYYRKYDQLLQESDHIKLQNLHLESDFDVLTKKERDSCLGLRDLTTDYENLKSE